MSTFEVTPENLSEYETKLSGMVDALKTTIESRKGSWKLFLSMDTESCGVNVRSVGFGIFLVDQSEVSTAQFIGGVNINILSRGVTDPKDCETADIAVLDGARTMKDFWSKHMDTYNHMNATSIPASDAVRCISMLRAKFVEVSENLHIILTARPLAYDYMVLQRLYDSEGVLNPFPSLGWYAFCMGTAIAFRSGNVAYSYNNFGTYIKKLNKAELDHNAMQDGIDQFRAYWIFLREHYGDDKFLPITDF